MHFCSECQNMYYIRIDSENPNKLVYYCRNCGNEDKLLTTTNVSVSKMSIKKTEQSFDHLINQYTKLDPTLPRTSKILCPNPECGTNVHDEQREIITMRYDDVQIKYIFMCSTCDNVWKMDDTA